MAWDYTEKLKDHFFNPRNVLKESEESYNADGVGEVGNIKCGDMMRFYIKIEEKDGKDIIKDCKWKTYGCASAIGSTSVLSEMVTGMLRLNLYKNFLIIVLTKSPASRLASE